MDRYNRSASPSRGQADKWISMLQNFKNYDDAAGARGMRGRVEGTAKESGAGACLQNVFKSYAGQRAVRKNSSKSRLRATRKSAACQDK